MISDYAERYRDQHAEKNREEAAEKHGYMPIPEKTLDYRREHILNFVLNGFHNAAGDAGLKFLPDGFFVALGYMIGEGLQEAHFQAWQDAQIQRGFEASRHQHDMVVTLLGSLAKGDDQTTFATKVLAANAGVDPDKLDIEEDR